MGAPIAVRNHCCWRRARTGSSPMVETTHPPVPRGYQRRLGRITRHHARHRCNLVRRGYPTSGSSKHDRGSTPAGRRRTGGPTPVPDGRTHALLATRTTHRSSFPGCPNRQKSPAHANGSWHPGARNLAPSIRGDVKKAGLPHRVGCSY